MSPRQIILGALVALYVSLWFSRDSDTRHIAKALGVTMLLMVGLWIVVMIVTVNHWDFWNYFSFGGRP